MSAPRDEDRLLDHRYDDIQEYDNPMPAWWVWILWVSILWAVLYFANVIPGLGTGAGRTANYEKEMAAAKEKYGDPHAAKPAGTADVAAVLAALKDAKQLEDGKAVFTTNCVACHRPDLGGQIGPNLTDDYWIHGNKPEEILATISNGVPDKGMPTWSAVLKPEQVAHAAAYVMSMHGTDPKEPKAPQGNKLEWGEGATGEAAEHAAAPESKDHH